MPWFKPVGLVFVPVSVAGWVATLLAFAFCAQIFFFVDGRAHSVSDTFYGVFPFWLPTFLLSRGLPTGLARAGKAQSARSFKASASLTSRKSWRAMGLRACAEA